MESVLDAVEIDPPRLLQGSRGPAPGRPGCPAGVRHACGHREYLQLADGTTGRDNTEIVAEAVRSIAAMTG